MGARGDGIVLIGLRRAGKTSVGTLLAARLGLRFVDTDRVVQALAGMAPGELLRTRGEAAFREIEAEAVARATEYARAVLATGGGAPLHEPSRARLRAFGRVLYLHVTPGELVLRAGMDEGGGTRPLLAGASVEEESVLLYRRRDSSYRSLADEVIEADADVPEVVERCMTVLGRV